MANIFIKKITALFLSFNMLILGVPVSVLASEISGVTPNGNVYNIEGNKFSGQTQFRHYDKFDLSKGDIANLIYKNGYKNFVNLVNNRVSINGLVNTMRGNNFYNGHAIFVSPNGIVIGASGVLNVGSLSLLTPSQSSYNSFLNAYNGTNASDLAKYEYGASAYNGLIKDSHGEIVVNGKILSREEVNLYGDKIIVQGTAQDKAGIIAGWKDENTVFDTDVKAKEVFNSLVSNNIKDATNFDLKNGKVVIVAGDKDVENPTYSNNAQVLIDNAEIASNNVDIQANSSSSIGNLDLGFPDEVVANISIKNSELSADDVKILVNATSEVNKQINTIEPTILAWILEDESHISEFFSSEVMEGFEGAKSNATVDIIGSTIKTNNDLTINTSSSSTLNVDSDYISGFVPAIFYALGTKTNSQINVKNSKLLANGDVNLQAVSTNEADVYLSNSSFITFTPTDAYAMMFLNFNTVSTTKVIIDNSTIESNDLNLFAVNYGQNNAQVDLYITLGENDFSSDTTGGSGVSLAGLYSHSKNDTEVSIINKSNIETSGDTNIISQSVNIITNSASSTIDYSDGDDKSKSENLDTLIKDKLGTVEDKTSATFKSIISLFQKNIAEQGGKLNPSQFKVGGNLVINSGNNSAITKIENSSIKTGDLLMSSHVVDLVGNRSTTFSKGEANFGLGVAVISNNQLNNTISNIDSSSIESNSLTEEAITEIPTTQGTIQVGIKLPIKGASIQFGVNFGGGVDDWSASMSDIFKYDKEAPIFSFDSSLAYKYGQMKPKFEFKNFFNNFAKSGASAKTAAMSGSVVYNNVTNNTISSVTGGSDVVVKNGNANIYAVNSVVGYNAVGNVDFLMNLANGMLPGWIAPPGGYTMGVESPMGVGGSVLVNNYENNAISNVDNSKINVSNGDLNIGSATEQGYISALAIGGKSTGFVMDGAVHVQNLSGNTTASITNSSNITATNLNLNAGKANVKLASDKIELDEDTGLLNTNDTSRDIVDHLKNIVIGGALAQQSEKTDNPDAKTSAGVAVGADVNVSTINRTVSSTVDNSTITVTNSASIISDTKSQNMNISVAGAFAGGVSVNKKNQEQGQQAGNNQQVDNVGNWQDAVDNAVDNDEDSMFGNLFDENNANQEGADIAHNNADNINHANGQIDNDGNVQENEGGNVGNIANNNGNLVGNNNVANPNASSGNMSIAAAGSVNVINDSSSVSSKITNATINVGEELNVKANQTSSNVNVSGAAAKAGTVGAGAGVNIYRNKTKTETIIGDSTNKVTINYTKSGNSKILNNNANSEVSIVAVALGVGAAANEEQGFKAAVGGSFNYNKLSNIINSVISNTIIKSSENITNNINVDVLATGKFDILNISGSAGYVGGGSTGMGAGIAANTNVFTSTLNSKIIDSTLTNVGDVKVDSLLIDKADTVGIAGAIVNGTKSSYTFDGAIGVELSSNKVYSFIENSEIEASGNVEIVANSIVNNQSLAGALEFSNATSGLGVGLGTIVSIVQNEILAKSSNLELKSSKSVEISANEKEDLKYLAVNMGLQTAGENKINVNGIANIFLSTINSSVDNNSNLNSDGNIEILSNYNNKLQGITIVGDKATEGFAIGANSVTSYYKNNLKSLLGKNSSITSLKDITINSNSVELINIIPVSVTVSSSGNAVASNILVNIIKNNVETYVYGDITSDGNLLVNSADYTVLYQRGGTLAFGGSTASVGGTVDVDYVAKNVKSEINGATIKSGDTAINATSETSFGGIKKDDGTYIVNDISDVNNLVKKDSNGNYVELDENSDFANWNMMYDLEGGNNAAVSGVVFVKVIENTTSARIVDSDITSTSLTLNSNDYAIVNAIAGKFNKGGDASIGGNVFVYVTKSNTNSFIECNTKLAINNDIKIVSYTKRDNTVIMVGGGGSAKVATNGSAYVNVSNDNTTSKIDGDVVISSAENIVIDTIGINSLLSTNLSVAGSGKFSMGGIFYYNEIDGSVNSLVGNDSDGADITLSGNVKINSDSDNSMRAYLFNVAGSGKIAVSGCGLVNTITTAVKSDIDNSIINTANGKIDVIATRGFNREQKDKSNIFRNWFKDTSAFKTNSQITDSDIANLYPIVGALNVGGAGNVSVSATMILNTMSGDVVSNVKNSIISSKNGLNILAIQDFVTFDTIAAVAGASNVGVNAVGVINLLNETVEGKLYNSTIQKGGVSVISKSNIDMNQLVVSGEGAGTGASVGAVVDVNKISDKVHSFIENSDIEGNVKVDAEHVIEINNIILSGTGAGTGASLNAVPIINIYNGETFSGVYSIAGNNKITNGSITIGANDYIDNFSAVAGISFVGSGATISGFVINNNYDNIVKSYIDNITINTQEDINIISSSLIDSTNALLMASIAATGASILANVVVNGVGTNLSSFIDNSIIENANNIKVLTNKDKQDKITNTTGNLGFGAEGANIATNVIYNLYKNTAKSYVQNSAINNSKSLNVESNSDRVINNINIAIGGAAIGATVGVNSNVNEIDTITSAYIDAEDNIINITNNLSLKSNDITIAENIIGSVGIAGLGAAVITNIILDDFDNLTLSQIITGNNGKVNAGSIDINSNTSYGLSSDYIGVSVGAGGLAGCINIVKIGKRDSIYSTSETKSGVDAAINKVKTIYDDTTNNESELVQNRFSPETKSSNETGTIARIQGNVKSQGDITVSSTNKVGGIAQNTSTGEYVVKDKLEFVNTSVNAGGIVAGVGVQTIELSNLTLAEIISSDIEANGNIEINANSKSDISITNTEVDIAAIAASISVDSGLQGASGIYNNKSETISSIFNSTLNSNNLSIISNALNKAIVKNRSVIVSGASVGVSISEVNNENKTSSVITGDTDITSSGKLTLQSTNDSDIFASMNVVNVSVVDLVSYMSNIANSNSVTSALIKDVTGKIIVSGLDIITESNVMSVSSFANIVSVSGVDIANIGKSGAIMNSEFISGIDSLSGLTLINNGDTNILSGVLASDNTNAVVMIANSQISKVGVSLVNTYASAEASATNTAKSKVVLKTKEHSANSLNISAKLNLSNNVDIDDGNVSGLSINSANLTSIVSGDLSIDVAGVNNIKNSINIIADSYSLSNAVLSNLSVGLLLNVANVKLNSTVDSNTNVNISGVCNSNETIIKANTERDSIVNLTSKSGGLVNVNSVSASNVIRGNSNVVLDGFNTNNSTLSLNKLTVDNKSMNTHDTISTDSSGGFVSVSSMSVSSVLDAKSKLDIKNSNIKSSKNISVSLENDNIIKDSASLTNGGIVAVATNNTTHTYCSSAIMNIVDSTIESDEDISLVTNSILRNAVDGYITYTGEGGGFVATTEMTLKNYLIQTSEINIDNSIIKAKNDVNITAKTTSKFKQKITTSVGGFVAISKNWNTLDVENNNSINLKNGSKILAANKANINLDSNNDLAVYSEAKSSHFGFKDPQAESYLYLTINNKLENTGSIEAGKLVDIDFMGNSYNYLTQYAYAEANAAIPTTTENGILSKAVNNVLTVSSGADITSGRDVMVNFSMGYGSSSSTIAYKCVCYALFGIPITKSGSKSNYSYNHNAKLNLDGDIVAGRGNNKYMKINRDGTIDSSTSGFYENEYTLINGQTVSPEELKQNALDSLTIDLNEINSNITEVTSSLNSVSDMITSLEIEKVNNQEILDMLNEKLSQGYQFITEDDLEIIINNNIKNDVVLKNGEVDSNKISESLYSDILTKYNDLCSEIAQRNNEKYEANPSATDFEKVPSIQEFLNNNYSTSMSDAQQTYFVNSYNDEYNSFSTTEKGNFSVYGNKYILSDVKSDLEGNVTTPISDYENTIKSLDDRLSVLNKSKNSYENDLKNLQSKQTTICQAIEDVKNNDYQEQESDYAILFNPLIMGSSAVIKVTGINNTDIIGQGNFKITQSGFKIDNYSNRSLYFDDIRFETGTLSGLYIGEYNYSAFCDKSQSLNNSNAYNYLVSGTGFDNIPTVGVHYVTENNANNAEIGITINNYYDTSNPFATSIKNSDIVFLGDVKSNSDLFVSNESGDIIFIGSDIMANNINMYAKQGDISILQFDNTIPLELSENSEIFAGGLFEIITTKSDSETVCINNGVIRAGYGDRNLTVTDDMLNNLIEDPTTGEKNMIDLGGNNDIKALYVDGKIILFNMKQPNEDAGSIDIDGKFSGNGQFIYTNGYSNIQIDNQTSKELVVNNLYNNKLSGNISNDISATNQGRDFAITEINSKGLITINKEIQSGLNSVQRSDDSILKITSSNGINLTENSNIISDGNTFILNDILGSLDISGTITSNGNLTISNNSTSSDTYLKISNNLVNKNGTLNIINNNGEMQLLSDSIKNVCDDFDHKYAFNIENNSSMKLLLKSNISNDNGEMNISSNGGLEQLNNLDNNGGNMTIAIKGDKGTVIAGNISNSNGDINLINKDGNLNILSSGSISLNKNDDSESSSSSHSNDLNIIHSGDGLFSIYGKVYNHKGDMTLTADNLLSGIYVGITLNDTNDNIETIGTVLNNDGILTMTNNGSQGLKVLGNVISEKGGIISNTNSKIEVVREVISDEIIRKGQINFGGNSIIINEGEDGIVVDGDINNVGGQLQIVNEKGSLTIGKLVTETGVIEGNITNDYTIDSTSTVEDKDVSIKISNTGNGDVTILGKIINKNEGDIIIENTNGGIIETTKDSYIQNNKGSISITNDNIGGIKLAGDIETIKDGYIKILNNGTSNALEITKDSYILSNKGNISIINNANNELNISGNIASTDGIINISNNNDNSTLIIDSNAEILNENNSININNNGNGGATVLGNITNTNGVINVINTQGSLLLKNGSNITNQNNIINIENNGNGGMYVDNNISNKTGNIIVNNKNGELIFETTSSLKNIDADIIISNINSGDMNIFGSIFDKNGTINISNVNSNIVIGEVNSTNDNYIKTETSNIVINQVNGSILNGISDSSSKHSNYDLGNPDKAYKTLIASGGDLNLNVIDGDIGISSLQNHKSSIDASSRDYTDSININVKGAVSAKAINNNKTDSRIINLRAKESDMKIKNITSDGGVILTAADWKQPDTRPTPTDEENYFKGYSILSANDNGQENVVANDISIIASDNIGSADRKFVYYQNANSGNVATVNVEAENNIYYEISAPSDVTVNIGKQITKRGNLELTLNSDAVISEISAANKLHILQKAKNLTIEYIGAMKPSTIEFNDMLYPHDGIDSKTESGIPQQIEIEVLDANGGDSANSTLKIYSAYVKGANNGNGSFDSKGNQLPDVKLMADNIFINAPDAPDAPNASLAGNITPIDAKGLNASGNGNKLAIEVKGVSKEFVDTNVVNANRTNYNVQKRIKNVPKDFVNPNDKITDYDYKANNVVISVNNENTLNRGVNFTTLYSDKAFVDTKDEKLSVKDSYITDYAEFRNGNGIDNYKYVTVVDNGKRKHLIPKSTWQLYTEKTGSFGFDMDNTIVLKTMAPVVHFEQHKLVNTYHSEKSMFNLTFKENIIQQKNKDNGMLFVKKNTISSKDTALIFDTTNDKELQSNVVIYNISTKGALIRNDKNLKYGKKMKLTLKFEDVDVEIRAKVKDIYEDKASIVFLNMPETVANKILYRYMQQANKKQHETNLGLL